MEELLETVSSSSSDLSDTLLNLRVTHKTATVPELEALAFRDYRAVLQEIRLLAGVKEATLLQTCNRVELCAVASDQDLERTKTALMEYWRRNMRLTAGEFDRLIEESRGSDVILHLLRLASSLESMIVGEDQILGQLQDAYNGARECGTVGPILRSVFEEAIHLGKEVRVKTGINKGAVSIGSAAINLLEEELGSLSSKQFIVIGTGELGALVAKALAARKVSAIFVVNRTYGRAVQLAELIRAQAVRFEKLEELLGSVDGVVVATSAPHFLLTSQLVSRAVQNRAKGRLLVLDLSQPRNVEKSVADIENVEVRNVDNLREIAALNLQRRLKEMDMVQRMIQERLDHVQQRLKRERVEPFIAEICNKVEGIRCRETEKALVLMDKVMKMEMPEEQRAHCQKIIDDFSQELTERILLDPLTRLRKAAVEDNMVMISAAQELFGTDSSR